MSTNSGSSNIAAATTTAPCQDGVAEIETALKARQVAPGVARSLALSLVKADLGVSYVEQQAEWIEQQAQVRLIGNPAGYLVWLVKQQMPVPTSSAKNGSGFAVRSQSQPGAKAYEEESNPEIIKRLPELIKLAEENLQMARGAQQREEIQRRLEKFRAIEAKLKQQPLAQTI
jgi:hypothetical protein